MLKNLVVLLIGILLGANAVYYVMTRGERRPAMVVDSAPSADAPVAVDGTPLPTTQAPARQAAASSPATRPPTVAGSGATSIPTTIPAPAIEGLIVPVEGVKPAQLSDTFDDARGSGRRHEALDIMAPAGTPVLAVADGSIEKMFDSKQGGLTVYQFEPSGRYAYYYAHLQSYAPGLAEKKAVKQGELIGYVGSTGNANAAAPHLHFAIFVLGPERQWWKGTPIDPYPLLGGR